MNVIAGRNPTLFLIELTSATGVQNCDVTQPIQRAPVFCIYICPPCYLPVCIINDHNRTSRLARPNAMSVGPSPSAETTIFDFSRNRCSERRCIASARTVFETFRSFFSKNSTICASLALSGGVMSARTGIAGLPGRLSALSISSMVNGFATTSVAPSLMAWAAVRRLPYEVITKILASWLIFRTPGISSAPFSAFEIEVEDHELLNQFCHFGVCHGDIASHADGIAARPHRPRKQRRIDRIVFHDKQLAHLQSSLQGTRARAQGSLAISRRPACDTVPTAGKELRRPTLAHRVADGLRQRMPITVSGALKPCQDQWSE